MRLKMLQADQDLLESQLKVKAISIQDKELSFIVSNFDSASTCSSLLAGFSFSALAVGNVFDGLLSEVDVVVAAFYCGTAVAFGSNFLGFITALLCRIQGVRLALKGPTGSMKEAVDKMRRYQSLVLFLLEIGVFSFHFSALGLAWIQLSSWPLLFPTSTLLLCSAVGTAYVIKSTKVSFAIPEGSEVGATLSNDRITSMMMAHTYSQEQPQQRLEMQPLNYQSTASASLSPRQREAQQQQGGNPLSALFS